MKYYNMKIAGLDRQLPLCRLNDDLKIAVNDSYGHSGKVPPLLEMYGLTPENIVKKAELALSMKK